MRTKTFRVQNNRIRFTCPDCETKRAIAVPPDTRRRSIRCPKCATRTQCILNRRETPRESQAGRVLLVIDQEREFEVNLHDISLGGLGFDLPYSTSHSLSVSQEVRFKCTWSRNLLRKRYVIRSIKGKRVGAQRM